MKNILTAITAFCLTFGLLEAVNIDVDVQYLEMPEFHSQRLEREVIVMPALHMKMLTDSEREKEKERYEEDQVDDGDSNSVVLYDTEHYCQVWPTKCLTK